ncbi:MAG: MFS transporter [Deltaproteobacteria bacterium]|jgi:predicted MFS family arabinose efflux permease|nr:MFS transporter [Deltaproteobacteria bacterium]
MSKPKKILAFVILSLTAGMAYFTPLLKFTFYDQMMASLSLDDVQLNVLSSVYALVNTFVYPISGILGDKYSARKLIALSMFAMAGLTALYSLTTSYPALIAIHAFFGLFAVGTFWAPYIKAIRSLGDESVQGKLFGWSEATRGLGQAVVGFAAVGILSVSAASAGFSNLLRMTAIIYAALGFLVLVAVPNSADDKANSAGSSIKGNMIAILKNPGMWIVTLMIMLGFAVWLLSNTYLTTYSVRVLGISANVASGLGIVRTYVIIVIAGFGGGWLMDKFTYKGKSLFVIFCLCSIMAAGIMLTSPFVPLCIALTMILTLITNVIKATYWSTLGQAGIPLAMTASATGIISFVAFIPESFITIVCGSWLKTAEASGHIASGFTKVFILIMALCLASALIGLMLLKRTKSLEKAGQIRLGAAS